MATSMVKATVVATAPANNTATDNEWIMIEISISLVVMGQDMVTPMVMLLNQEMEMETEAGHVIMKI
jgi:hypothetical protein